MMDQLFSLYPQYEYPIAAIQLVLAMVGLGATLTPGDFGQVVRQPKAFSLGFLIQLVVVPLAAFAMLRLLDIEPGLAVGISLIAAIPGGSISNVMTYLGKGSIALSVSLTGVVTLCCLGTTPLILDMLASEYMPATFEMPVLFVIRDITLFLLLPLAAGMAVHRYLPTIRERFSKWCIRASVFFIAIMVVGSLGSGRMKVDAYGWTGPLIVVGFSLVIYTAALVLTRAARLQEPDVIATCIEVVIRNTNLALLLQATLFPVADGADPAIASAVLFVVLFYGGNGLVFGTILVVQARSRLRQRLFGA